MMSDWLVEIVIMKGLLKFVSTKSGGVFATTTITTIITGGFALDKWFVDNLAIRD